MLRYVLLVIVCLSFSTGFSQQSERPKLVVGIVVDQMRQEYLYRYSNKFTDGGFKRLVNDGFMLRNAHYNYAATLTGSGHASIYTGTTPAIHGIIENTWYDKVTESNAYCVSDASEKVVGSESTSEGQVSPRRMLTSTITDELKLFTQKRSKVISISIKDRGAALPGGHMADAAYWYDKKTGRFITSTYYMNRLPAWVEQFNSFKLADKYLSGNWTTLLPISQYEESGGDNSPYEQKFVGENKSTFPYNLKALRKDNDDYDLLSNTPFSNDYLTDFVKSAIDSEKLGASSLTDFLCISFSAPDKIGHRVGSNSVEIQDVYLRLDRNIEDLLNKLDRSVGKDNYLVFLTSDHGVADVPQFLIDNKIPAGYLRVSQLAANLKDLLNQYFPGKEIIKAMNGDQIYLNHQAFSDDPRSGGIELLVATELISNYLIQQPGIANVFTKSQLRQGDFNEGGMKGLVIRSFHPKRSGDIAIILEPSWLESGRVQGTTHGSPYTYDTHVPIVFYGKGIRKGSTVKYYTITDIAPTLSMLLKIKLPNGCTGQPIEELFD